MADTSDQAASQDQAYFDKMKQQILDALEAVIVPELGVDLINLGLIYGVDLDESGKCTVEMTLTDMLDADIKRALTTIDGITSVEIHLVWYPAWGPERLSRYAKMALGIH